MIEPRSQRRQLGVGAVIVLLLFALAASAACLHAAALPFAWIGWGWGILLFVGCWYHRGSGRALLFNLAFLFALLGAAESYFALQEKDEPQYSNGYYGDDDLLGYAPNALSSTHAWARHLGKPLYDVTYTIGADRLRVEPPSPQATSSVLFFGCSFTYGEGLQDDQAMPYQVGLQTQGRYRTYNFGFHGYAPNQMLAEIESGRLQKLVTVPPRIAIYQALPDHVRRVAGKIPYGHHNPKYRLNPDGSVSLVGHFDDGRTQLSPLQARLRGQLKKSSIYRFLNSLEPRTNDDDVRLLLAIVRQSRNSLTAQYPGIDFQIILWPDFSNDQTVRQNLRSGFEAMKIPVHRIEDILPDYGTAPERYWLNAHDQHPNALADKMIADYVATKILPQSAATATVK